MTQPKAKPRAKLTYADYVAMTPLANSGPRYQLIEGQMFRLPTPHLSHQTVFGEWLVHMALQTEAPGTGQVVIAPFDVVLNEFNVFQPDLLYVSEARQHVLTQLSANGAPDVVIEILSDPTRRRYLEMKLPIYSNEGVREVLAMDLDSETVTVYYSNGANPTHVRTLTAEDALISDAMPGITIDLGRIFARGRRKTMRIFSTAP